METLSKQTPETTIIRGRTWGIGSFDPASMGRNAHLARDVVYVSERHGEG